jgi:hypothetical protein
VGAWTASHCPWVQIAEEWPYGAGGYPRLTSLGCFSRYLCPSKLWVCREIVKEPQGPFCL